MIAIAVGFVIAAANDKSVAIFIARVGCSAILKAKFPAATTALLNFFPKNVSYSFSFNCIILNYSNFVSFT